MTIVETSLRGVSRQANDAAISYEFIRDCFAALAKTKEIARLSGQERTRKDTENRASEAGELAKTKEENKTTLTKLKEYVRIDLHDNDSNNYRWDDSEIERHILHATNDLSIAIPLQRTATIPTTGGSRDVDISQITDRISIYAAGYPLHLFPRYYRRFIVNTNVLTLTDGPVPNGENICIYYKKAYSVTEAESEIPSHLEELVICGACGYAAVELAIYSVNRINTGGDYTAKEFLRWGEAKINYFRGELKKRGHNNRLRINRLYRAYQLPFPKISAVKQF
ncbi:MAG: hypothetical protein WC958_00570 [Dehalococcoidales bacterium]